MKKLLMAVLLLVVCAAPALRAEESKEDHDARMKWFRDARFGMFIHWGLYSQAAGEINGRHVGGAGEWIMESGHIKTSEYAGLVKQFNPVKFDAKEWVRIAKDAGMKYIVITSKHHDGFGLWRSELTDWCIKSTPFQRDPLKELAAACKEAGITFCLYHSIMDWHHPDWTTRRSWNDTATGTPDMDKYTAYMKGQLKELLTGYGPLGILWFDGEWEKPWTHERGVDLYNYLRELQPSLIINNRVGKGRAGMEGMNKGNAVGDYGTPEQQIPATGFGPGVDWESCMTMNGTWGYRKDDNNWKSATTLIRNLIDCSSKGGNYLLNVGPTGEGEIPAASVERLAEIGKWMKVNSEAVYGTTASPFAKLSWGRCTQKPGKLYLHVYDWPKDGKLRLPISNKVAKASLLAGGTLKVTKSDLGVEIALPSEMPDKIATVIVLDIKGQPAIITADPYANETPEQRAARMAWWHEAKFGMFIHWGVYSVPAGTYHEKKIPGIGEWIMNRGKIPRAEYQSFAKQFNPVKYNADEWVRLAKEAGMKYIVITSKHHDGFTLYDSKASNWNVVKASPYGKDLLKPLAAACRKYGIKLGFYYSQAQDWNNGGAGNSWDPANKRSMDEYIDKIAVPQVREILTKYGEFPAVLWWDTPHDMNPERAEKLITLLKLKPGIIHNNRLGGGYRGDTETPEQTIPATGYKDRDWETCMTMNDTWGFKSYDNNWKPTASIIHMLCDIASKGGNYLLNVGPTAEGLLPAPSVERLKEVGTWMKVNGDAIYGTTASPFQKLPFNGRCTQKPGKLYLHVFNWPTDGKLLVPVTNKIRRARLLADLGKKLDVTTTAEGSTISLPANAPDSIASVVLVEIEGTPDVIQAGKTAITQSADGSVKLLAVDGEIVGSDAKLEEKGGVPSIGYWTGDDRVEWKVDVSKPGTFNVEVTFACEDGSGGSRYVVQAGQSKVEATVEATGSWAQFKTVKIGQLKVEKAGAVTVVVKPVKRSGAVMNLRSVTLKPVTI